MKIAVLIVAAGRGIRAGGEIPKQYRPLAGKPVLQHTIEAMLGSAKTTSVTVVISENDRAKFEKISACFLDKRLLPAVIGGAERQVSVHNGLESLSSNPPDIVLIHDAARPFTPPKVFEDLIDALKSFPCAFPVLPIVDALWKTKGDIVVAPVPRDALVRAQTPQGFHYPAILKAHREYTGSAPDDVTIAHAAGLAVKTVAGDSRNFKITLPEDFAKAERILEQQMIKCGNGFDVHAFESGNKVTLCGVDIPHDQSLKGHSDADVAMHAITDAIYGALAEGDIGRHFPPSDAKWRGAASEIFLKHASDLASERGYAISHIDCTIICEHPKIGPHADAMRHEIARIVSKDVGDVSIKATTSEGLGFTGRKEGIAAMATATLVKI